jgi:arabinose-5-phosphate isomerase
MNILAEARNVFDIEIDALKRVRDSLDGAFEWAVDAVRNCEGKVILTGVGKTGHIASKIAATLSSLGTSAFFMNAAEAMHGDLGLVERHDVVIIVSNSGESEEIKGILPSLEAIGAKIIAVTARAESTLAKSSYVSVVFPKFSEACYMNLAPTSSTTCALVLGDALAIICAKAYGFTEENFGLFHPGGLLGKKLLTRVSDAALSRAESAVLPVTASLTDVITVMCNFPCGIAALINADETVAGVISDGDIRRLINAKRDIYSLSAADVMTTHPLCLEAGALAAEALELLRRKQTHAAPVLKDGKCAGIITVNAILSAGLRI